MSVVYRCRLCLKSSRNKINVFKDDFPKMIELLTGLKVDPYDDFPKTSCLDCARNVKTALKTRNQIIQSHKVLLEEFLLKCRETSIFETNIDQSLSTNINSDREHNILEIQNKVRANIQIHGIARRRLKLAKEVELKTKVTTLKEEVVMKDYTAVITSRVEALDSDVEIKKSLTVDNSLDDTCDPSSPLSNSASDQDWLPEEEQKKSKKFVKDTKPPSKASDGVFFIKKRINAATRKPKSSETFVRIKKKPKGRVPPKRVTCDICKREVQSYWLQKHMETHQYNPVTCEFCGLVSKSATALRHHVFYYHRSAADEYMCDQCARSFRSKYRLNLHKKKEHGGTKDFECTTCGKKFFERMHLKRHVDKTHKNIRPYACEFCGKSFKSKNHIKIHERIHSKEAPYNCHMCGESFKMKLTLRTHLKGVHNVHEEQKVFCDVCKRGFASDVALKAHLNSRIHETEKCQYCSEMFTREYMVKHLRDVHNIGETL